MNTEAAGKSHKGSRTAFFTWGEATLHGEEGWERWWRWWWRRWWRQRRHHINCCWSAQQAGPDGAGPQLEQLLQEQAKVLDTLKKTQAEHGAQFAAICTQLGVLPQPSAKAELIDLCTLPNIYAIPVTTFLHTFGFSSSESLQFTLHILFLFITFYSP